MLIFGLALAATPAELHEAALASADPIEARELLEAALAEQPPPDLTAAVRLDLARLLGPGQEAEALIDATLPTHRALALAARGDLAWASDDRAGALAAWTEELSLHPAGELADERRALLAWRHLVGTDPTDADAIEKAVSIALDAPFDRIAYQRDLPEREEVLVRGGGGPAPMWVVQIGPAHVRWARPASVAARDILAVVAQPPRLKRRFVVGASIEMEGWPWPEPERIPSLAERPAPPPPPKGRDWTSAILSILLGALVLGIPARRKWKNRGCED